MTSVPARSGMVEMDVGKQQVTNVAKPEPVGGKAVLERGYRRGRPAIEERRTVVGVDEVDADRVSCAAEVKVDRLVDANPWSEEA